MKKYLYSSLLLLLLFSMGLQAQTVLVMTDKMNILYVGVPNPVSLCASGYQLKDIKMEMDNAEIAQVNDSRFLITPRKPGPQQLRVYGKGKLLGEFHYRVQNRPLPTANFSHITDEGSLSRAEFMVQKGIAAYFDGFDYDLTIRVVSYRVRVIRDGHKIGDQQFSDGPLFSAQYRELIQQVQPGDEVLFSGIICQVAGNHEPLNSENPYIRIVIKS